MKSQEKVIIAAFESWSGGTSSMVYGEKEVAEFCENHYNSGSFAELHTFASEKEAEDYKAFKDSL